jgi:acyl-coenzyme A thioesterase PaaI-like protein
MSRQEAIRRQLEGIERIARATPAPPEPLQRIALGVRRLGRFVNTTLASADELAPLARELDELLGRLPGELLPDGASSASRFADGRALDPALPLPNPRGTHPLLGCINPVAPPLELRVEGDRIVADVEFDVRYEGNRGWVHGGFVAAGFDIMVVTGARLSGSAGPTGALSVRFVAPTPIGEPLRYESWLVGQQGRKLQVRAHLLRRDTGAITAEAEGIVVAPRDGT